MIYPIYLASSSPRRRELLKLITSDFQIIQQNADETYPLDLLPEFAVRKLAERKALSASSMLDIPLRKNHVIVGADTLVFLGNQPLGKPKDQQDAVRMLHLLSGQIHQVITGVCLCCNDHIKVFHEISSVKFFDLTDDDIQSYIETGEPFDKAGAYGIQGYGSLLVESIHGDFNNIVGLPVSRLNRELNAFIESINGGSYV